MKILRMNEFSLANDHEIFQPPQRIVDAALGMFDARITDAFSAANVVRAYENAIHKLRTAFPTVMQVFGDQIVAGFLRMDVGKGKKLKDL